MRMAWTRPIRIEWVARSIISSTVQSKAVGGLVSGPEAGPAEFTAFFQHGPTGRRAVDAGQQQRRFGGKRDRGGDDQAGGGFALARGDHAAIADEGAHGVAELFGAGFGHVASFGASPDDPAKLDLGWFCPKAKSFSEY